MRPARTYRYRLLKSSWGIQITITAQVSFGEVEDGEWVDSAHRLAILFADSVTGIPDSYKQELGNGLAFVAPEIVERLEGAAATVTVLQVTFTECDFQIEGLAVAICRWAEAEFDLRPRQIDESFDRGANRYVFDWH